MGQTTIKGSVHEILADYSVITLNLAESLVEKGIFTKEEAKEQLQDSFDMAFLGDEERHERVAESLLNNLERLLKILKEGGKDE